MLVTAKVLEYLNEVREEACGQCAQEVSGDRSSGPGNTPCGFELPLAQLIEVLGRPDHSPMTPVSENAPSKDQIPPVGHCPCPAGKLAELARKAAELLEERTQRREHVLDQWIDG